MDAVFARRRADAATTAVKGPPSRPGRLPGGPRPTGGCSFAYDVGLRAGRTAWGRRAAEDHGGTLDTAFLFPTGTTTDAGMGSTSVAGSRRARRCGSLTFSGVRTAVYDAPRRSARGRGARVGSVSTCAGSTDPTSASKTMCSARSFGSSSKASAVSRENRRRGAFRTGRARYACKLNAQKG